MEKYPEIHVSLLDICAAEEATLASFQLCKWIEKKLSWVNQINLGGKKDISVQLGSKMSS